MILKNYFIGYYCGNKEELETISKESHSIILDTLKDSYPNGLNAHQLEEKTGIPIKTVYRSLQDLERELFIRPLGKHPKKPGRPSIKDSSDSMSERYRISYIIENMSRIYDHIVSEETQDNYPLSPGNIDYSSDFLEIWHKIVGKEEEENISITLLQFLERIFSRINGNTNPEVMRWAPTINEDFCCLGCGINHEARDFFRAMLLHLMDHLEKNDKFIQFMVSNGCINKERYRDMIAPKANRFKEKDMVVNI